jgi:opacity protein-like surface antigen
MTNLSLRHVLLTTVAAVGFSGAAMAADAAPQGSPWYIGAGYGTISTGNFDVNELDSADPSSGYKAGGFIGRNLTDNLRGEVEVSYQASDADCIDGKCGSTEFEFSDLVVLGNAWLDMPIHENAALYVGGGVGMGNFSIEGDPVADNKASAWGIAYQAGAGARMDISEAMTLDLGYRYQGTRINGSDLDEAWFMSEDLNLNQHVFQLSLSVDIGG